MRTRKPLLKYVGNWKPKSPLEEHACCCAVAGIEMGISTDHPIEVGGVIEIEGYPLLIVREIGPDERRERERLLGQDFELPHGYIVTTD